MNSQQYCEQKILKESSCLYYSLRFITTQKRYALLLLHTLFHEIDEIRYKCQDIRVAQQKRDWWQQEINQAFSNRPTHPITQDLSILIEQYAIDQTELVAMVDALTRCPKQFSNFMQLEAYCEQTSGQLQVFCTKVLGYQQDETLKAAKKLGIMLQLFYFLRELRRDTLGAYIYLPQDELAEFKVTKNHIFEQQSTVLQPLLARQIQRIYQYHQQFLQTLPKNEYRQQKMGLIRAKLAIATLKEMQHDNLELFRHRISLTPLRKLLITMVYLF